VLSLACDLTELVRRRERSSSKTKDATIGSEVHILQTEERLIMIKLFELKEKK
jgi:hypothetical protein